MDLVPIRPIDRVTTFAEDITTDACRSKIRNELKDWKADVVAHDGAPNVGPSWGFEISLMCQDPTGSATRMRKTSLCWLRSASRPTFSHPAVRRALIALLTSRHVRYQGLPK